MVLLPFRLPVSPPLLHPLFPPPPGAATKIKENELNSSSFCSTEEIISIEDDDSSFSPATVEEKKSINIELKPNKGLQRLNVDKIVKEMKNYQLVNTKKQRHQNLSSPICLKVNPCQN